jgi:toxin ParE1/3/4
VKVAYSPRAVTDLAEIGSYLAERSPPAAVRVERRIRALVDLIAYFPAIGRTLADRPSVRVMPVGSYPFLVFYQALDDELIILHIRHAAREPLDPNQL